MKRVDRDENKHYKLPTERLLNTRDTKKGKERNQMGKQIVRKGSRNTEKIIPEVRGTAR